MHRIFQPGTLMIPEIKHIHEFLNLPPLEYALLTEWIYSDNKTLPNQSLTLLDTETSRGIKYALVRAGKINILVIRGSDNVDNFVDDISILQSGGKVHDFIEIEVRRICDNFSKKHGKIHVATGHSLGGRLVEIAVQEQGMLGITFNAYLANKSDKIIAFRVELDIAQLNKGHTDRLISKNLDVSLLPIIIKNHLINVLIEELKKSTNNYWTTSNYYRAKDVAPEFYRSETDASNTGQNNNNIVIAPPPARPAPSKFVLDPTSEPTIVTPGTLRF